MNKKSRTTSFLLTLLLGPLGLLYASLGWGLILLIVAVLLAPTIVVPLFCWVLSIALGDHIVHRHNQGIDELIGLIRGKV
jgi:hypothetical protein